MVKNRSIAFCSDVHYIIPTYIALFSLLKNYRGTENLEIYIIAESEDVFHGYGDLFRQLEDQFEVLKMHFVVSGPYFDDIKIKSDYITNATMLRLLIPALIDAERCLYLDSDLVVEDDISDLTDTDLDGYCVAGVRDLSVSKDYPTNHSRLLGIPTTEDYLQGGALLMNLEEIHRLGLDTELAREGKSKMYPYNDQDVINLVCFGKKKILDLRNNVVSININRNDKALAEMYGKSKVAEARKRPLVFHYAGFRKPWKYRYMYGASRWWKYIQLLDHQVSQKFIGPFLNRQGATFRDQTKEKFESLAKAAGLFPVCKKIEIIRKN